MLNWLNNKKTDGESGAAISGASGTYPAKRPAAVDEQQERNSPVIKPFTRIQPGSGFAPRQPGGLRPVIHKISTRDADPVGTPSSAQAHPKQIYERLLAGIYDAVIVTNQAGYVIETNDRVKDIFGCQAKALIDVSISKIIRGITPQLMEKLRCNIAANRHVLLDANCTRADQTTFPAEVAISGIALFGANELIFLVRNTEKRRNAMNKMRSFHNVVETLPSPVILTDCCGVVTYANQAITRLTGIDRDTFLGRPLSDFAYDVNEAHEVVCKIKDATEFTAELTLVGNAHRHIPVRLEMRPDIVVKGRVNGAILYISPIQA